MSTPAQTPDLEILVTGATQVTEIVSATTTGFGPSDESEQHASLRKVREVASIDPEMFLESWRKAFRAVEAVFTTDGQQDTDKRFVLETVTAKLSLTASGKIAFIGELGGEVAFEVCFRRST